MHLTPDSQRRLLERTLRGPEALALANHLEAPCDACETFLSDPPRTDAFDGAVDRALLALAPGPQAGAGRDLEYARIDRAVRSARARRRWLPGLAAAAALAVAGLAGLLFLRPSGPPAWDGTKGTVAPAVPLRLRFLVVTPGPGGPAALEKGLDGQEVPAAASLQFQVELGRAAHVLLARSSGGAPEVFLSTRLGAGRHVISLEGQPAAYPLAALSGTQRFLALASEAPLGPADAVRAVQAAQAARSGASAEAERSDGGPNISLDQVEVRVRP